MEMLQKVRLLIVVLHTALPAGWAAAGPAPAVRQVPAPALVPGVSAVMNTPGYWIGRHPDPDRLVMTAAQIAAFNDATRKADSSIADIAGFGDAVDGEKLKADLGTRLSRVQDRGYYLADGQQPGDAWWQSLEDNMNLAAIGPEVRVRFGLIAGFCDHRVLPLAEGLYDKSLNLSFDRLQDSTLDIASPVAILHRSRDGRWLYAAGETMRGWVPAESVALCERDTLRACVRAEKLAVVTAAKADLYADENLRSYLGRVQMGTRLPVARDDDPERLGVLVPGRNRDGACTMRVADVRRRHASPGPLPYTPRTILDQAFKLLHTPYGWGGLFGEQDCSRFVQEVFATVGLVLPRNSSEQANVGRLIYADPRAGLADNKRAVLSGHAAPALTLLHMDGHIMLFLGFVDDRPYIIHDLWSYRVDASTVAVVGRVAVTPADLGNDPSGALLDKVNTIRVLDAPATQTNPASFLTPAAQPAGPPQNAR